MEQEETQEQVHLPLTPRLDKLDLLMTRVEETCNSLLVPTVQIDNDDAGRNIDVVLEEVPTKGSLLERVTSLEHRLLKLTVELEQIKSKSFRRPSLSSGEEKYEKNILSQSTGIEDQHGLEIREKELDEKMEMQFEGTKKKPNVYFEEKEIDEKIEMQLDGQKKKPSKRKTSLLGYRKFISWIQIGC